MFLNALTIQGMHLTILFMHFKKSTFVISAILFLLPSALIGQERGNTALEVKLSGDYYWGEGFSEDRQYAIELARQSLSQKILVRITSTQNMREGEVDGEYSNEFLSEIQAQSRIELRDLMIDANQRRDGSWEALAYITMEKFEENLKSTAARLLSELNQALRFEESGRHQRAIAIYSEIYLSTLFFPRPIFIDEAAGSSSRQLRSFVRGKIMDWFENIELRPIGVRDRSVGDRVEMYIDLQLQYRNEAVNGLKVALNRPGYGMHDVSNGESSIYFDRPLEEPVSNIQFRLTVDSNIISDSELSENLGELLPQHTLSASVDFSEVITLDFGVNRMTQSRYRFTPILGNLSVFDLEWEMDGDIISQASMFDHTFASFTSPRNITLRINRHSDLYITKRITPEGEFETVSSFKQVIESRPAVEALTARSDVADRDESEFVSTAHSAILREIMTKNTTPELTEYLSNLQQRRILRFGSRNDVTNTAQSYIAIINPQTNRIVAFLTPEQRNERFNLTQQQIIRSNQIQTQFSGHGPIWFQFSRN